MTCEILFEDFLLHGKFLKNWSPKTERSYRQAFASFQQSLRSAVSNGQSTPGPTKAQLETWVIWMRQKGMSPGGCNVYIRGMNSFCSWLKAEGHIEKEIKLKQLATSPQPVIVFSDSDIRAITSYKPKQFPEFRTWTLLQFLLDTGCRINELLGVQYEAVDFDNLLVTVNGKGGKYRKVPFSMEMRKCLWRYVETRKKRCGGTFVFCARHGVQLRYRNIYRDIIGLCRKVGITKHVHPHLTRHTFACHFMKHGGSIYSLSRILGHSSINTTQTYIRGLRVEDFQEEHARLSPLARC